MAYTYIIFETINDGEPMLVFGPTTSYKSAKMAMDKEFYELLETQGIFKEDAKSKTVGVRGEDGANWIKFDDSRYVEIGNNRITITLAQMPEFPAKRPVYLFVRCRPYDTVGVMYHSTNYQKCVDYFEREVEDDVHNYFKNVVSVDGDDTHIYITLANNEVHYYGIMQID